MESIIFNYIGYVFVFCAALCLAAPVVVHLVSLAVGVIWQVIDEGDSKAPDLLEKVMPFLYSSSICNLSNGQWAVLQNSEWCYASDGDGTWRRNGDYVIKYCAFNKKEEAEAFGIKQGVPLIFNIKHIFVAFAAFSFLGIGFTLIPTITMYALSSALCLYSLRWSRRGYKKVMKLKVALDEHAKDKDAHK
jgi:hypothetical protein